MGLMNVGSKVVMVFGRQHFNQSILITHCYRHHKEAQVTTSKFKESQTKCSFVMYIVWGQMINFSVFVSLHLFLCLCLLFMCWNRSVLITHNYSNSPTAVEAFVVLSFWDVFHFLCHFGWSLALPEIYFPFGFFPVSGTKKKNNGC